LLPFKTRALFNFFLKNHWIFCLSLSHQRRKFQGVIANEKKNVRKPCFVRRAIAEISQNFQLLKGINKLGTLTQ